MVVVTVNIVQIKMEVDTGAECSTIPAALFEYSLQVGAISQVTLQQYDQIQLKVVGQ